MHLKYIIRVNLHCKCFILFNQRNNEPSLATTLKLHMKDRLKPLLCHASMRWISESLSFLTKVWKEVTAGALILHLLLAMTFTEASVSKCNEAAKDNGVYVRVCMCACSCVHACVCVYAEAVSLTPGALQVTWKDLLCRKGFFHFTQEKSR